MEGTKMAGIFQNLFARDSEKEIERKVDILSSIVERNKIKNSGASIDEVVESAQRKKMRYRVFF